MAAWMGIADFLREVDQLARNRSDEVEVAPVRLLPGENPESLHPDDADHWASVYDELSEFTTQLLRSARPNAYEAADSPRVQVLEAELERFHTSWSFWTQRLAA
jgi:hypothetical protein